MFLEDTKAAAQACEDLVLGPPGCTKSPDDISNISSESWKNTTPQAMVGDGGKCSKQGTLADKKLLAQGKPTSHIANIKKPVPIRFGMIMQHARIKAPSAWTVRGPASPAYSSTSPAYSPGPQGDASSTTSPAYLFRTSANPQQGGTSVYASSMDTTSTSTNTAAAATTTNQDASSTTSTVLAVPMSKQVARKTTESTIAGVKHGMLHLATDEEGSSIVWDTNDCTRKERETDNCTNIKQVLLASDSSSSSSRHLPTIPTDASKLPSLASSSKPSSIGSAGTDTVASYLTNQTDISNTFQRVHFNNGGSIGSAGTTLQVRTHHANVSVLRTDPPNPRNPNITDENTPPANITVDAVSVRTVDSEGNSIDAGTTTDNVQETTAHGTGIRNNIRNREGNNNDDIQTQTRQQQRNNNGPLNDISNIINDNDNELPNTTGTNNLTVSNTGIAPGTSQQISPARMLANAVTNFFGLNQPDTISGGRQDTAGPQRHVTSEHTQ